MMELDYGIFRVITTYFFSNSSSIKLLPINPSPPVTIILCIVFFTTNLLFSILIYHNGNKLVTHQIPTGIFYGLTCIIGSGCVIDIDKLEAEMRISFFALA
mgnify:CR=1 FL=1